MPSGEIQRPSDILVNEVILGYDSVRAQLTAFAATVDHPTILRLLSSGPMTLNGENVLPNANSLTVAAGYDPQHKTYSFEYKAHNGTNAGGGEVESVRFVFDSNKGTKPSRVRAIDFQNHRVPAPAMIGSIMYRDKLKPDRTIMMGAETHYLLDTGSILGIMTSTGRRERPTTVVEQMGVQIDRGEPLVMSLPDLISQGGVPFNAPDGSQYILKLAPVDSVLHFLITDNTGNIVLQDTIGRSIDGFKLSRYMMERISYVQSLLLAMKP